MKNTRESEKRNDTGPAIREARRQCQPPVSQDDLSGRLARLGVMLDRSAISRIENQNRYLLDYELAAIAKSLKVKIADLFNG